MLFAGSGRCDSRVFGVEGASGYLRGAAGQHGGPAQDGEGRGERGRGYIAAVR